jgi:hypothetical protein
VIYTCYISRQKLYILREREVVHAKNEKKEEIKVRHDERKKFV